MLYLEEEGYWIKLKTIPREEKDVFEAHNNYYSTDNKNIRCMTKTIINNYKDIEDKKVYNIKSHELAVRDCEKTFNAKPNELIKEVSCKKIVYP